MVDIIETISDSKNLWHIPLYVDQGLYFHAGMWESRIYNTILTVLFVVIFCCLFITHH